MGRIRLKVRELADERGWTLKEVSERSTVPYATVKNYAQAVLATVDYTALQKLARTFDVTIEDLVEVIEEWKIPSPKSRSECKIQFLSSMGLVRLRIRELAEQRGWSLQEVAEQAGVNYNTVKSYARRDDGMNTVDLAAVHKIASAFEVTIEDLIEVIEE
jgi:putative transcriptional regulator